MRRACAALLVALATPFAVPLAAAPAVPGGLPEDHRALARTISYDEMEELLQDAARRGLEVTKEAVTAEGRAVYVVHARRGAPEFRVLFYAQQHGDEVSGKDALLYLVRDLARRPESLPEGIDLFILPMVNPDGAAAGKRRNAAGIDLNRDHMVLEAEETRALHRVVRRVRPHLAVDAHEFTRDGAERRARGFVAWPDITMDGLNNPLFDPAVVAAARRWVDEAAAPLAAAGYRYDRYTVGGPPPDVEQRHSSPDVDGALNAVGTYGGLSFIIEAGVRRNAPDPSADLGRRVDAYLRLFRRFLEDGAHRAADVAAVEAARRRPLPAFLPTNYLWVNPGFRTSLVPVVEIATGRMIRIPTANLMTDVAVKSAVATPRGYAVEPRAAADFEVLLERHAIPFEVLQEPRTVRAGRCTARRLEDEYDEVYARYEGRQIVRCDAAGSVELPAGSLWVPLAGESALRAALLLEPRALYGLYQYPRFRPYWAPGAVLPVAVVESDPR